MTATERAAPAPTGACRRARNEDGAGQASNPEQSREPAEARAEEAASDRRGVTLDGEATWSRRERLRTRNVQDGTGAPVKAGGATPNGTKALQERCRACLDVRLEWKTPRSCRLACSTDVTLGFGGASPEVAPWRGSPLAESARFPTRRRARRRWTACRTPFDVDTPRVVTRTGRLMALGSYAGREAKGRRGWQRWVKLPRPRDRPNTVEVGSLLQDHDGSTEPVGC